MQSLNEISENERCTVRNNIADFTEQALQECPDMYINFRWWQNSPPDIDFFAEKFNIPEEKWLPPPGRNHSRITGRLYSSFDHEFAWPSQSSERLNGINGSCRGLIDHCGILCDGRVVPCCLDSDGELALGNLHTSKLAEIINSDTAKKIADGFRSKKRIMSLCQKCGFASRFDIK